MGLQVNVQRADVFEWLKRKRNHDKKYEIIFADAPFETEEKNTMI
jgi:23S rRNA G2069 N7-methylase RlmK/C1962 C5-methylase RlmI